MEPMNAVTAMTSLTVAGGWVMPLAFQNALMPSASAWASAMIARPFAP